MRYMLNMLVTPEGVLASADLDMTDAIALMGAYNEQLVNAGVLLSAEGLSDAAEGFRVDFSSAPPVITDGPFAEVREVFTGFWLLEVASREEAQLWAAKCPLGPGVLLEVRRVQELDDLGVSTDNEWIQKEMEWRAAND